MAKPPPPPPLRKATKGPTATQTRNAKLQQLLGRVLALAPVFIETFGEAAGPQNGGTS